MYGDTHMQPAALFDPLTEAPPARAFEVYFPAPPSLSLFAQACASHNDTSHLVPILAAAHDQALRQAVITIQHAGGYVADPHTTAKPARLQITALAENTVVGTPGMLLHAHVYVGDTAPTLADARRLPLAQDRLRRSTDLAWLAYTRTLIAETTAALDLTWGPLPGHHPSDQEILDPPFGHLTADRSPPVCPGRFNVPLTRLMADATWRQGVRQMQQAIAVKYRPGP